MINSLEILGRLISFEQSHFYHTLLYVHSARKRPIPYQRSSPLGSDNGSDDDSDSSGSRWSGGSRNGSQR